jgi:hypothetical protein
MMRSKNGSSRIGEKSRVLNQSGGSFKTQCIERLGQNINLSRRQDDAVRGITLLVQRQSQLFGMRTESTT